MTREETLDSIKEDSDEMAKLQKDYIAANALIKKRVAEKIDNGKYDHDLTVAEVAKHLGKTRQAVNQLLVDVFGVRSPEKAAIAKAGHEKRKETV